MNTTPNQDTLSKCRASSEPPELESSSETSVKELAKELLNLYGCSPVGARFSATLISKEVEEYLQHLLWYAPGITRAYLSLLKEHQIQAEASAALAKGSNRLMEEMKYLVNKNERLERGLKWALDNAEIIRDHPEDAVKYANKTIGVLQQIQEALATEGRALSGTTEPTLNTDENGESE